jgi:quinol monooxygenase YgiN
MRGNPVDVTELAAMRALDGHGDLLASSLVEAASVLEADDGCLGVRVMRCVEDPDTFSLQVDWTSVAAHEAFRGSAGPARFRDLVGQHLAPGSPSAHYKDVLSARR